MRYIYIHGFNSGPQSRSGAALEQLLGKPVLRAHNDYSQTFHECMAGLERFVATNVPPDEQITLIGTSLGAFYALQMRLPGIARVAAFNPVIYPAVQLAKFLGENCRFTDGQTWHFGADALHSYAEAADSRVWHNFYQQANYPESHKPERKIWLGSRDDVLDHETGLFYWKDHAPVSIIDSGHSIADFSVACDFLI